MIAFGLHAVMAVLDDSGSTPLVLVVSEGTLNRRQRRAVERAEARGCVIERVRGDELDALSNGVHQGVLLRFDSPQQTLAIDLETLLAEDRPQLALLLLDGVTDPRNLGACVRSAAAWGIDAVLTPVRRSAPVSPVALKAASGGFSQSMGIWTYSIASSPNSAPSSGIAPGSVTGARLTTASMPAALMSGNCSRDGCPDDAKAWLYS